MYKKFSDLFTSASNFQSAFQSHYTTPTELFDDNNWFMPFSDIIGQIYNILLSRSFNKYFIWESLDVSDDELNTAISGQFFPTFFDSLLRYYKTQLVLLNNEIKDLKNWEDRSNQSVGTGSGAVSSYSQPAPNGSDWDDTLDAPTGKNINRNTITSYNKPDDLAKFMKFNFSTYLNTFFAPFEKFFIPQRFVKELLWDCGA